MERLRSGDEKERFLALEELREKGKEEVKEAFEELVRIMRKDSFMLREKAIDVLKEFPALAEDVARLIGDEDPYIRNSAIEILAAYGKEALPILRKLMKSEDHDIRKLSLDAISMIGGEEAENIFISSLPDADLNIVAAAVEYLGKMRSKKASEKILKILSETSNIYLAGMCANALILIGEERVIEALRRFDVESEPTLIPIYIKALGAFDDDPGKLMKFAGKGFDREIQDAMKLMSNRLKR